MKKDGKKRLVAVLLSLLLLAGGFFLMAGVTSLLLRLFGLRCSSFGSFLLFFLGGCLFSVPGDLLARALPKVLHTGESISRGHALLMYLPLEVLSTFFGFALADRIIRSVEAARSGIMVLSWADALFDLRDFGKSLSS